MRASLRTSSTRNAELLRSRSPPFLQGSIAPASAVAAAKSRCILVGDAARVVPQRLHISGMASPGSGSARSAAGAPDWACAKSGAALIGWTIRDAAREHVGDEAAQLLRRGNTRCAVAGHLCRSHDEVNVVRVVAEPIDRHRRFGSAEDFSSTATAVYCRRARGESGQGDDRCIRHVHEVTGAGNGVAQVESAYGSARSGRSEASTAWISKSMAPRMVGVLGEHPLRVGTIATLCRFGSRPPGFQDVPELIRRDASAWRTAISWS